MITRNQYDEFLKNILEEIDLNPEKKETSSDLL